MFSGWKYNVNVVVDVAEDVGVCPFPCLFCGP